MEKNRYKNDYREHVRCGMQRRVNILMSDIPKKGNISSETEKIFKVSRDKIFLKQNLNLYIKRTHPVLGNSDSYAGEDI